MLPTTSPVKYSQQFSTRATEWGKSHESVALEKYIEMGLVCVKAGFVICEEYPFLGASPDGYVNDPSFVDQ